MRAPRPFQQYGVMELLVRRPRFFLSVGPASSSFAALTVLYATNRKVRIPASAYAL